MYPYLRSGLGRAERERLLDEEAERLGFIFRPWRRSFSMCAPWGVIYLAPGVPPPVKAHELTHARRMGRWPWLWTLLYLLSPWRRQREEVEAEAMEAAFYYRWVGRGNLEDYIHAPTLGTWRAPHFMGGDREELLEAVAETALRLLA